MNDDEQTGLYVKLAEVRTAFYISSKFTDQYRIRAAVEMFAQQRPRDQPATLTALYQRTSSGKWIGARLLSTAMRVSTLQEVWCMLVPSSFAASYVLKINDVNPARMADIKQSLEKKRLSLATSGTEIEKRYQQMMNELFGLDVNVPPLAERPYTSDEMSRFAYVDYDENLGHDSADLSNESKACKMPIKAGFVGLQKFKTIQEMKKNADHDVKPYLFNSLALGRLAKGNFLTCPLLGFSDRIGLREFTRSMRGERIDQVIIMPTDLDEAVEKPMGVENQVRVSVACSALTTQFILLEGRKPNKYSERPSWSLQGVRASKAKRTADPRRPLMEVIGGGEGQDQLLMFGTSNGQEWIRGKVSSGLSEGTFLLPATWIPYSVATDHMVIPCIFRNGTKRNKLFFRKHEARLEQPHGN